MKHFSVNDDFERIIKGVFPSADKICQVSTGWTNFVFVVKVQKEKYVFRFPRNDFFLKVLKKEAKFCDFLQNLKLKVQTPKLKLFFDKGRVFSVHKMIEGKPLSCCHLLPHQKRRLAKDSCEFLKTLSQAKTRQHLPSASRFLQELSLVSGEGYDLKHHATLEKIEKQEKHVLSHGDFNPGNLLVKRGKLVAVLDFAFASRSSPKNDLARIIGRLPKNYKKCFLSEYQKIFGKIDQNELDELISMWHYVEKRYVMYIKKAHPDILLPKSHT